MCRIIATIVRSAHHDPCFSATSGIPNNEQLQRAFIPSTEPSRTNGVMDMKTEAAKAQLSSAGPTHGLAVFDRTWERGKCVQVGKEKFRT